MATRSRFEEESLQVRISMVRKYVAECERREANGFGDTFGGSPKAYWAGLLDGLLWAEQNLGQAPTA